MRTIKEIQKEITLLEKTDRRKEKPIIVNRICKRLLFLRDIKTYLEIKNPTKSFIESELKKLEQKKELIEEKRGEVIYSGGDKEYKAAMSLYNKETGLTQILNHIKTMKYILS